MMSLINIASEAAPTLISEAPKTWSQVIMQNPGAWLCWLIPIVGALLMPLIAKGGHKARDWAPVAIAGVAMICAWSLLPGLFAAEPTHDYEIGTWITFPKGDPLTFGVLVDPLSIIMANVVATLSFFIILYSVGYMHGDEQVTRYWFFFLYFIGSMLLLVLGDNLIMTMIGWEGVGICSYGLIGYYYRDAKERWLGGPPPTKMFPPSHAGMKAFVVTGIGDVLLLGAIFIIYNAAGTLNYVKLIETAPHWMAVIAGVPGLLSLTAVLFLGGPVGKSAQFPLHEWLPEAMAGPTSVSALIHAATMVKAGVYLVARMAPAFYLGYYVQRLAEAQTFFVTIAIIGAVTAFLAASQALVALELKKVLAYSTVSQIGFMMLALGVSGFSGENFVPGLTAGIFHLVSHALFKAALFLAAGSVIHAVETIYMSNMGGLKKYMKYTYALMGIATLSLMGFPGFAGFWSKDAVFVACLNNGTGLGVALFAVAAVTALMTFVYSIRYVWMVFNGPETKYIHEMEHHGHHPHEAPKIMWVPVACIVVLMLGVSVWGIVGAVNPSMGAEYFFEHQMDRMLEGLEVEAVFEHANLAMPEVVVNTAAKTTALAVTALIVIGGSLIGYWFWIGNKIKPWDWVTKMGLKPIHGFLWNRWYINDLYYAVFVNGVIGFANTVNSTLEAAMLGINDAAPKGFTGLWNQVRKAQTGWLTVNLLYLIGLLVILAFLVVVKGV